MTMMIAMMHSRAEMTAYTEILLNILPLHQRLKFILALRFFVKLKQLVRVSSCWMKKELTTKTHAHNTKKKQHEYRGSCFVCFRVVSWFRSSLSRMNRPLAIDCEQ